MKQILCVLSLFAISSACSAEEIAPSPSLLIDASRPQISNLKIGMERTEVAQLNYKIRWQQIEIEGDSYDLAFIEIAPGVEIIGTFDKGGTLYSLSSSSGELYTAEASQLIGASLKQIKSAYPGGRFISGFADKKYANFLTGTHLILRFNPDNLPAACFEPTERCIPRDYIEVIEVYLTGEKPD